MTEAEAFLAGIIENPDDDGLRLVYADWLEEHGQPERAELIRLQVGRARMLGVAPRPGFSEAREWELLHEHESAWAGHLRGWTNGVRFRRGFVEEVTLRPEAYLEHADALFQAAPVRRIDFMTAMLQLSRPHLVHASAGPLMPKLAACRHLARLSAICFRHNLVGDGGVEALAGSPHLARLASLDLSGNDAGDAGAQALADSPGLACLASLSLGSNRIGSEGARALACSPLLKRLASLDMGDNPLGDEGVTALAASPNLCRLATLHLARSGMGTAGARALAASPHLDKLESLDVRDNIIGNKARQALRLRFGKGKCRF